MAKIELKSLEQRLQQLERNLKTAFKTLDKRLLSSGKEKDKLDKAADKTVQLDKVHKLREELRKKVYEPIQELWSARPDR